MNDDKSLPKKSESSALSDLRESIDAHLTRFRASVDNSFDFYNSFEFSWQSVMPATLGQRNPVPIDLLEHVYPLGVRGDIRYVGEAAPVMFPREHATILTLSGGGANGAYGAGLLAGWTQRGSRPEFDLVMGVSTGAIIGLFAFMGMAFDDTLRHFYTEYATDDLVSKRVFQGLALGTSLFDTTKLSELIRFYVDDVAVMRLAEAHAQGRRLLVGTTNLDQSLPVTWDLTAIASSQSLNARELIREVILASCAIPVAFPPVLMPMFDDNGNEYDEMHVDGGATQQMLIHAPIHGANVYAIVNNRLNRPYQPVESGVFNIAGKALSTLIAGSVTGDLYRLYARTQKQSSAFSATWIPNEFGEVMTEMFERKYMRKLYEFGFQAGVSGNAWQTTPPDY